MTQEEKQLLIKDLCARLPYGVKGLALGGRDDTISVFVPGEYPWVKTTTGLICHLGTGQFKPYLRPMSSMMDEERTKVASMTGHFNKLTKSIETCIACLPVVDYCYSRYLDIHGLIEKELALEAPEGMYKNG